MQKRMKSLILLGAAMACFASGMPARPVQAVTESARIVESRSINGTYIVEYAKRFLGRPYVYGATGPNSFDCSGLTQYVYKNAAGISIGRSTYDQINSGKEVAYKDLQPGDLVFTSASHVGIYVGNGQMIHAPRTGEVVKISPVYQFWRARRILNNVNTGSATVPQKPSAAEEKMTHVFSSGFYAQRYSDLRNAFGNNERELYNHFKTCGIKEGRTASETFDVKYYLNANKDLKNAFGANGYEAAFKHANTNGIKEGRELSPVLDIKYYKEKNPDVAKAFGNDNVAVVNHFLSCGIKEGRSASENFDVKAYKGRYSDLAKAYGNNYQSYFRHYLTYGISEGRNGKVSANAGSSNNTGNSNNVTNAGSSNNAVNAKSKEVFDAKFYAEKYTDLRNAFGNNETALYNHFITCGIKEGRTASETFDVKYYLNSNNDLKNAFGANNYQAAFNHFLTNGIKEERALSPVLNIKYYKEKNPDVARAFGNDNKAVLNHFITCGAKEGRDSSPNFVVKSYKARYTDLQKAFGNDYKAYFRHYLTYGMNEGRNGQA